MLDVPQWYSTHGDLTQLLRPYMGLLAHCLPITLATNVALHLHDCYLYS